MAKILNIANEIVEIGEENGRLTEVRFSDLSFTPRIGDNVEVYRSENSLRVILATNQTGNTVEQSGQGININLSQAQTVESPEVPYQLQSGKVVNKIAYILFAIFLGGFGIHKFIAGKVGLGILYIVFCWTMIPSVVGIIEGLVACGKKSDLYGNIVV